MATLDSPNGRRASLRSRSSSIDIETGLEASPDPAHHQLPPLTMGLPRRTNGRDHTAPAQSLGKDASAGVCPPSFGESQLHTIIRRQISRPKEGGGFKASKAPSRFPNTPNRFEFAGWGSLDYLEINETEAAAAQAKLERSDQRVLGHWMATQLAAPDVFGSPTYAFPAVVAVASVYSPISLLIATLLMFFYRPIMAELASAIPVSGANYTYALHTCGKATALAASVLTILDNVATAVVCAATAASYIAGETSLSIPIDAVAILILIGFSCIALAGLKESAYVAFAIVAFHLLSMAALTIGAIIIWAKRGNATLLANFDSGHADGVTATARAIFDGICLAFLGLTGLECTPNFASSLKPGAYPKVLRNLHLPAIALNGPLMVLILATIPLSTVTGSVNVFATLAEVIGGRWMRIWIAVDCVIVTGAGTLTGAVGGVALLTQMTQDRILPTIFCQKMPLTGSLWVSIISFCLLSCLLYVSTGFSLVVASQMLSVTFILCMGGFGTFLLLLKLERDRLPRTPKVPLVLVLSVIALTGVVLAGNIALNPTSFAYFAAYFIGIYAILWAFMEKVALMKCACWVIDQVEVLRRPQFLGWAPVLVTTIEQSRQKPVVCLVKTDEIDRLFSMLLYVSRNETTSNVKLIHFYDRMDSIPSELEANSTIVDEAFPSITVDLIFVQSQFTPAALQATCEKLGIERSMCLMTCPSEALGYSLDELGARVITL